jgi:tetrahydromethanopterin S-methyltransferase subunit A
VITQDPSLPGNPAVDDAASRLREAAAAKKCWSCGCLHNTLTAIEGALPSGQRSTELDAAMQAARERLVEVRYDCLGCELCYPALAINALNKSRDGQALDIPACSTEKLEERKGWPPFPGAYTVLRYGAPVAVCALTDDRLAEAVTQEAGSEIAIVGTLQTENLGIERLIQNVLANPIIRFVVVCGPDSRQAIGHLPGQSLVALSQSGLDDRSRIVSAKGKRPVLKNIKREAVEHFRRSVEVIDLIGSSEASIILEAADTCAAESRSGRTVCPGKRDHSAFRLPS